MKYYVDTEFNAWDGVLLSVGLISEQGQCFYAYRGDYKHVVTDAWVKEHVCPIMLDYPADIVPNVITPVIEPVSNCMLFGSFAQFLHYSIFMGQTDPVTFVADWPDDIKYLCQAIMTGPGKMIDTARSIHFQVQRVDSYPTDLANVVQHNALWDAIALRYALTGKSDYY